MKNEIAQHDWMVWYQQKNFGMHQLLCEIQALRANHHSDENQQTALPGQSAKLLAPVSSLVNKYIFRNHRNQIPVYIC